MPDIVPPGYINRPVIVGAIAVVAIIAVLVVVLASWDIPAPKQHIEKVIPNDRLPR